MVIGGHFGGRDHFYGGIISVAVQDAPDHANMDGRA